MLLFNYDALNLNNSKQKTQNTKQKMSLKIYNTLSREKELFTPLTPDHVGMYVCGPTVYSDVHLGNCRTFISFDIIYRYLVYLGSIEGGKLLSNCIT